MKKTIIQILLFTLVSYYGYAQNSPQIAEIEIVDFNTSVNYGGGSGITIHFNPKGVYKFKDSNDDNKFFLELSDASGSFSNPTILEEVDAFFTTAINAELPDNADGGYKLRIRASKGLTGFTSGQPSYGEVLSPETASFTINSGDNYNQPPVTGYSNIDPNNSLFNCTDQGQFANETMFGSVTASSGNTTSDILNSTTAQIIDISNLDSGLTYSIKRINVFDNTITDLGTITNNNPHLINDDLPLGTYNYELQAVDNNDIASVYSVILVLHRNATTISNSTSNQICVGSEFLINVDTSTNGIGENFYGSYYTVDFGDGSPVKYYTHAQLMLSEEDNQISYQYNDVSCGALGNDESNFDFKLRLFNKFNTNSNSTCTYQENGGGVSKEVNTSLPPEASFTTDDICQNESLIVTNTTSLGQYGIGSGTQGCLDSAEFEWEIKKPDGTNQIVLVDSDGDVLIGPQSWVTNVNTGKPDLEIPASALTAGCWGIRLKTLNNDLCQTNSFFPSENSFYTVNVQAQPQADFSITDQNNQEVTEICSGQSLQFTDTSNISSLDCQQPTYTWDISPDTGYTYVSPNDSSSQSPGIIFNEPGVYTITQTISNLCGQDSRSKDITILGDPTVEFNPSIFSVCETIDELNTDGYTLDFNDPEIKPVYSDPPFAPSSYNWTVSGNSYTFINGTSSTDPYPVIQFDDFDSYNISVQVDGQCLGSNSSQLVFDYKQTPEITNTNLTQTLCSGETTEEVIFNSNIANTTYAIAITADNAIQGYDDTLDSGPNLPEMTLTNSSNSPADLTYTVTPTSDGCEGDPVDFTFTVNPSPQVNNKTAEICSGEIFNISPANGVDGDILPIGTTYIWTIGSNPNVGGESSVSSPQTEISQQLTNTSNAFEDIIYDVTPVSSEGCEGAPFTIIVTVNPEPVVSDQTVSACSDSTLDVNFQSSTSIAAGTYNVIDLQLNDLSVSGGNAQVEDGLDAADLSDDSFTNTTNAPVDVLYTVVPVSDDGCEGDSFTVTATINPEPVVNDQTATICSNEPVGLTLSNDTDGPSVGTYNLTNISSVGLTGGSSNVTVQNGLSADAIVNDIWENVSGNDLDVVYTFVPVGDNGCEGDEFTVTITVNPEPAGNDSNETVSSNVGFSFDPQENINNGGNGLVSDFTWEITNTTGTVSGANIGDTGTDEVTGTLVNTSDAIATAVYEVTPTSTSGCEGDPFTITVTVNPEPVVDDQTVSVCSDTALGVDFGSGNTIPVTSYNVTDLELNDLPISGGGPQEENGLNAADLADDSFTNITNAPVNVNYTVIPVSSEGVEGAAFEVTATINPEPVVNDQIATICSNEPVGLTLGDDTDTPSVATYSLIDISAESGLTAGGSNQEIEDGLSADAIGDDSWENLTSAALDVVYTFVPVGDNGCEGDEFTVTITVNPEPAGNDSNETVSSNVGFSFDPQENINNGGNGLVSDFTWEITNTTGTVSGANIGDTGTDEVTGTLVNTSDAIATAVYEVTPTSTSGCEGDPFTITVTVNPEPVVDDQTVSVCSDTALGVDFGSGNTIPVTSYNVTDLELNDLPISGGGPQEENGLNAADLADDSFTNITNAPVNVNYTVIPVSSEGVEGAAFEVTATINPEPVVNDQIATICSNEPVGLTLGDDTDTPSVATYSLIDISAESGLTAGGSNQEIEDGLSADAIGDDSWENLTSAALDVVYTFVPVDDNGCEGDAFTVTITVNSEPEGISSTPEVCSGSSFNFDPQENINNGGNGLVSDFTWEITNITGTVSGATIGDTGTDEVMGTLVNTTDIIATVEYEVTPTSIASGCQGDPFTITVSVNPVASLEPIQDQTICSQSSFDDIFVNSSTQPTSQIQYEWEVINAGSNLSGYTASSGLANLSNPISGEIIINASNNAEDIEYTVTPYFGDCPGTSQTFMITILPNPEISDADQSICSDETFTYTPINGGGLNGNDIVPNNTTYTWSVENNPNITGESDQTIAQDEISQSLINTTNTSQVVVYTITPLSSDGCEGSPFDLTITVEPKPVINNKVVGICSGESFMVNPSNNIPQEIVSANTLYTWNILSGQSDLDDLTGYSNQNTGVSQISQNITNLSNETKTITYEVIPESGACIGEAFEVEVNISPKPIIENLTASPICSEGTFLVSPQNGIPSGNTIVPDGTTYTWTVEDNPNITGESDQAIEQNEISQTLVNTSSETQALTYAVVPDSDGCEGDPFEIIVEVKPRPFIPSSADLQNTQCSGDTFVILPQDGVPTSTTIVPEDTEYTWVVSAPNSDLNGWSDQTTPVEDISQTLINTTNQIQQITYTVTPEANGCIGPDFDAVITVEPKPFVSDIIVDICDSGSYVLSPQNGIEPDDQTIVPEITKYSWNSPSVTGGVTGGSVGNDEDFFDSGVLNNPTDDIQTVIYTVTPKYFTTSNPSTPQCVGDEFTITITVGPIPNVNAEISNISCSYSDPLCGGSIEISPEGLEPFTYNWTSTNGNISNPSNKDQFNLCPGEYTLEITDSFGCTNTYDYTIEPPTPVSFELVSLVDLSCNNVPPDCDGYIDVDLTGGTEPYTELEWYTESVDGSGNFDILVDTGSDTISNACEGNYVLKVFDSNGCEFISPVYNIEETGSPITINDTISDYNGYGVSCFNSNDGFIEVDVSGGSGSFTYSLSPGNVLDSDPSTPSLLEFENLSADDYTLTINDDNCPADITLNYTLEAPSQITTSHELTSDPAACFGDTATYNVSASGGVSPYIGTGNYTLNAGEEHEIVITDANGCSSIELITIPEPTELTADASIIEPVECFGETATVEITASGGTPPYSGTGEFNVGGGDYVFTVTDANDCTYSNSIPIPEPNELVYNIESVNNPTCSPDRSYSNGSICISITGGTDPFPIGNGWTETVDGIWCLEGLASGTYLVDVTDDNGCLSDEEPTEVTLTRPEPLDAFITNDINSDCSSNTISQTNYVFVSGGTPPYEISWSGGGQCDPINQQCMQTTESGVYTAFIHDQESLSNNCPPIEVDVTVDLPEIGNASFNYSSPNSNLCDVLSFEEPVSFISESTGDIVNLSWDFGDGSAVVNGDPNPSHTYNRAGTYQVELTVEYAFGCTKTHSEILEITKGYDIVLPNAFTPNGDGMNDTIRPVTLCFKDVKMSVYDTFGSLIYIENGKDDTLTGWDGTIDGRPAENGNYIIVVEATTYAGETIKLNGPVTLIK